MGGSLFLDDVAAAEFEDPTTFLGELEIVGDHHEGGVFLPVEPEDELLDLVGGVAVEIAGRLIAEQNFRLVYKGPGQRNALLLPARKLHRIVIVTITQPNTVQQITSPLFGFRSALSPELERHQHVFQGGQGRDQLEILKYESNVVVAHAGPLVLIHGLNGLSGHHHRPRRWLVQAGAKPQQGGFAAPGRTENGEGGPDRQIEAYFVQHRQIPTRSRVGFGQVLDFQHGLHTHERNRAANAASPFVQMAKPLRITLLSTVLTALAVVAPADERSTILFYGDSLTAGYGLEDPMISAFPAIIQSKIDEAGLPYRVVNAGLSGETSAGGLRRINWVLRQPVDVFVLELGANDGLRGLPLEVLRNNLQQTIDRVRAKNPDVKIVVAGMRMPVSMGEYAAQFDALFAPLAEANDAALIPFLLEDVGAVPEMNLPDGIHPNIPGHKRVAQTVWTVLEPLLQES